MTPGDTSGSRLRFDCDRARAKRAWRSANEQLMSLPVEPNRQMPSTPAGGEEIKLVRARARIVGFAGFRVVRGDSGREDAGKADLLRGARHKLHSKATTWKHGNWMSNSEIPRNAWIRRNVRTDSASLT